MVLGAAIGGSIGGLILIVLVAILILLLRRRRKREDAEPTFDIPQSAYPVPYTDSSEVASIEPFVGINTSTGGRTKDGKEAVMSLENPSEAAASSSRRLSAVSVAPSYHTVAPERA